ncbi:MAG: hypothetical protein Q7R93_02980 [bacterium]|nr:hypothetical protein [bacterium]
MKKLFWIVAAIVLSITLIPAPASAQQVAQDQPKEAIKASLPAEIRSIDVSGNWTWRIIPTGQGSETTFDVKLTQDGEVVKGNFDCSNCRRIVNDAPIKGTLRDGKLQLARGDLAFSGFELIPTQDVMTGVYTGQGNLRYQVEGKRKK